MPSVLNSLPVFWGGPPPAEGVRFGLAGLNTNFVVPAHVAANTPSPVISQQSINVNLSDSGMGSARGIFIDNSLGPRAVFFQVQDTGQTIFVPPFSHYRGPLLTGALNLNLLVYANVQPNNTSGQMSWPVPFRIYNVELQEATIPVISPFQTNYNGYNNAAQAIGLTAPGFTMIGARNPFRTSITLVIQNNAGVAQNIYWGFGQGATQPQTTGSFEYPLAAGALVNVTISPATFGVLPTESFWMFAQTTGATVIYNETVI